MVNDQFIHKLSNIRTRIIKWCYFKGFAAHEFSAGNYL